MYITVSEISQLSQDNQKDMIDIDLELVLKIKMMEMKREREREIVEIETKNLIA